MGTPQAHTALPAPDSDEWSNKPVEFVYEHYPDSLHDKLLVYVSSCYSGEEMRKQASKVAGKTAVLNDVTKKLTRTINTVCIENRVNPVTGRLRFDILRSRNINYRNGLRGDALKQVTKAHPLHMKYDPSGLSGDATLVQLREFRQENWPEKWWMIAAERIKEHMRYADGLEQLRQIWGHENIKSTQQRKYLILRIVRALETASGLDVPHTVDLGYHELGNIDYTVKYLPLPSSSNQSGDIASGSPDQQMGIIDRVPLEQDRSALGPSEAAIKRKDVGEHASRKRIKYAPANTSSPFHPTPWPVVGREYGGPAMVALRRTLRPSDYLLMASKTPTLSTVQLLELQKRAEELAETIARFRRVPGDGPTVADTLALASANPHPLYNSANTGSYDPDGKHTLRALEAATAFLLQPDKVVLDAPKSLCRFMITTVDRFSGFGETAATKAAFQRFCATTTVFTYNVTAGPKFVDNFVAGTVKKFSEGPMLPATFLDFVTARLDEI